MKAISAKLSALAVELTATTKKLARDDPRRVVHALKVGLAITLVSLLYYFRPLYDGFGTSTMWAIITVIVVFEFSVGKNLFFIFITLPDLKNEYLFILIREKMTFKIIRTSCYDTV